MAEWTKEKRSIFSSFAPSNYTKKVTRIIIYLMTCLTLLSNWWA